MGLVVILQEEITYLDILKLFSWRDLVSSALTLDTLYFFITNQVGEMETSLQAGDRCGAIELIVSSAFMHAWGMLIHRALSY